MYPKSRPRIPKELHDRHNEYPLAPKRLKVNKVHKLIPNLINKEKYVIHHENLKQYISLGLKLTKIHSGIKFNERSWLKDYIQLNTDLRMKGTTDFEKDFFKLMNNSVFGKTMENIRNRIDVRLVTKEEELEKLVKKPNFDRVNIFTKNLVAVHMHKTTINLMKPIYSGMSILDLSKTLMYDSIIITLNTSTVTAQTSCLQIRAVWFMGIKRMTSMKISPTTSQNGLTRAITQKTIVFKAIGIKKLLGR